MSVNTDEYIKVHVTREQREMLEFLVLRRIRDRKPEPKLDELQLLNAIRKELMEAGIMIEVKIVLDADVDNYTNEDEVVREVKAAIDKHVYGVGDEGRVDGVQLTAKIYSVKVKALKPRRGKKI